MIKQELACLVGMAFFMTAVIEILGAGLCLRAQRALMGEASAEEPGVRMLAGAALRCALPSLGWAVMTAGLLLQFLESAAAILLIITAAGSALLLAHACKLAILKEPVVWSDFLLFREMLRHPDLYFAYIPRKAWLLMGAAAVSTFGLTAFCEREELLAIAGGAQLMESGAVLLLCGAVLMILAFVLLGRGRALTYMAAADGARLGPAAALLAQFAERVVRAKFYRELKAGLRADAERMPEAWETGSGADCLGLKSFILVQAESYVPAALLGFKALAMEELAHSEHSFAALKLYYQGAYTMRTEFSVLTGIDCRELGIYAYDPYLLARCCPVNSLAREFKSRGFSAICLHPHDRRFFARDEVISNLGFDFFIAGEDLENLEHHGPHVSDEALLSYAAKLTQNCGEKLFIFVITMEAHGPWLRGRFADKPDLTAGECYARHLKSLNAGVMKLCKAKLPCLIYGDHQPALPEKILHGAKPGVLGLNLPGKVNLSGLKDSLHPWELTAFIKNRLLGGAVHA